MARLSELVPVQNQDSQGLYDARCDFLQTVSSALFPGDEELAKNAMLAGMTMLHHEDMLNREPIVPESIESDQLAYWFAGQLVLRALELDRTLEETTINYG